MLRCIVYTWAFCCLCCFLVVETKTKWKKPTSGGGQGTGHRVTQAEIDKLEDAIQISIEKLKIDLKEDSASIRDEVANLRLGEADIRDNLLELMESMIEMKRQLNELTSDKKAATKADVPLSSEGCNKSSAMFQAIQDQLKDLHQNHESNVPVDSVAVCNKSSEMFEVIQEQLKSCKHDELENTDNYIAKGKCNTTSFETLKGDLDEMKEEMKKLVETCLTGPDDQTNKEETNNEEIPFAGDCNGQSDGVHNITTNTGIWFFARCEAGWLILAYRYDGSVDFNLEWAAYKQGFGDIRKEHFVGMDNIVSVLQQQKYKARFDLTTWENETRYAEYTTFGINNEKDKYRLNIGGYSGTAGNSMKWSNGLQFSTKDSDNDNNVSVHCALTNAGPYWYDGCNGNQGSIFGIYSKSPKCYTTYDCITWARWEGELPEVTLKYEYSFKEAKIKIRPI